MNVVMVKYTTIQLHALRYISSTIPSACWSEKGSRVSGLRQPPGFVPPHIWLKQRQEDQALKTLLFGATKKENTVAEKQYLSYASHASVSGTPVTGNFSYEIANNINEIPKLDVKLLCNLNNMGLSELTPVQKHAIGIMSIDEYEKIDLKRNDEDTPDNLPLYERVTGKFDLMAAAQTGSGKTLAYLIPSFNRLLRVYPYEAMQSLLECNGCQYPSLLILAPTRELVQQILSESLKLCNQTFARPVAVYGGERPDKQLSELSKGCHVMIATPGRLLDFLQRGAICLQFCRSLVLDEADRMLDMGFEKQIRQILESPRFKMPPPTGNCRQTVLFSATFPHEVTLLATEFLRGPSCVSLSLTNPEHETGTVVPAWGQRVRSSKDDELNRLSRIIPKEINQRFEVVDGKPDRAMPGRLLQLIQETKFKTESDSDAQDESVCRILVFCNTKREVDDIDGYLRSKGVKCTSIHGDKPQIARSKAMELFRKGAVHVLVASSVAARGIDIPNVHTVVNIGLPSEVDDYVHRIGRTGRMGNSGNAVTLVSEALLEERQSSKIVSRGICQLLNAAGLIHEVPQLILDYADMDIDGSEDGSQLYAKKKYSDSRSHSFFKSYGTRYTNNKFNRRYD